MAYRRKPKGEWLWEQIAALKRGRLEPETPAGQDGLASASRILRDALRVPVDPEREALSRYRLMAQLRREAAEPRCIVATRDHRSTPVLVLQVALPMVVVALVALAAWCLPGLRATQPPTLSHSAPGIETPTLSATTRAGSLIILRGDRFRPQPDSLQRAEPAGKETRRP